MDLKRFLDPFPSNDIEWRIQKGGLKNDQPWALVLAYVTNRAIMERLDEVCGPENWKNDFKEGPNGGLLCGISIKTDIEWVTKWDGADNTQVEAVKGGLSGAMKRAGVQWGIGRYLYKLDATWAVFNKDGRYNTKISKKVDGFFRWDPPKLPAWALPEGEPKEPKPPSAPPPSPPSPPDTGKLTTAQHKKIEAMIGEAGLDRIKVKLFLKLASLNDMPKATASNMIDRWDDFKEKFVKWEKESG